MKQFKRPLRKMIAILRNADPSLFMRNDYEWEGKFCSLGVVADTLGYDFLETDEQNSNDGLGVEQFIKRELGFDDNDPKAKDLMGKIVNLNDNECESYCCVANELEKEYKL